MQLLCLGDIAIGNENISSWEGRLPGEMSPGDDLKVLINWEFPIGEVMNPLPRQGNSPRFRADPKSPHVIKKWSPGFAALATNHILDTGIEGLASTIKLLNESGFSTVGAGMVREKIEKPLFWETQEGKLAIINWVFPETHPDWMSIPGPNCWPGIEEAKKIILNLKHQVDWVMVLAHWSDELFPYPRPEDRVIARELADAGTDILVSHHPHVVRGMEVVGTCPVFYSLGNFYFSEFEENSGSRVIKWAPRNREALGINISFKHGMKPDYKILSFWQVKGRVVKDSLRRAARRMKSTSSPLVRFIGKDYDKWYSAERNRFDRYWIRWHFGVRRLGWWGSVRYALRNFFNI